LRLLFTFAGGTGHFLPLVPLARAAEAAGHAVAFAGQEGMVATVEETGFAAFDTGGGTLLRATERTPLLPLDPRREERAVRETYAGRVARSRAGTVLALSDGWRPDVLVCEEVDFGAVIAAERRGLPYASFLSIASGSFDWAALAAAPLNELRAEHGLAPDPGLEMLRRHLVLSPFPASFRDPRFPLPRTTQLVRPASPEAERAFEDRDGPLVYFTLGTIFNLESGDLFERVLAGLRELPATVVVTTGREVDPAALGPKPPNVHVEGYVPQAALLPRCDLVVSHGGSGSVIGALAHGVPLVLLPMGADQPFNAARCEALGVAAVLDAVQATPADVRDAAARVLGEQSYRDAAGRLRDEIAAMPPPAEAVSLLDRLAG
jgi:UDP:flavonoid glycosyltransferase YjiC (YdhE family)